MKKLLLINPVGRRSGISLSRFTLYPPLGLAYVAGATPPDWDIRIVDENFEPFQFEKANSWHYFFYGHREQGIRNCPPTAIEGPK